MSVTPLAPSGMTPGDLVLISAGIRGASAKVRTPSGWKALVQHENLSLLGRIWQPTDTLPPVTFQGGAAGDTTLARAHVFRFTNPDVDLMIHDSNSQTNAVAQDIDVPAVLIGEPGCLVINLGLKQDDFSFTSRAGFDVASQNSSTTGNDAGTTFWAKIQTVPASEPAGTIIVTGGAGALSWSIAAAIKPYVTTWTDISGPSSPCLFPERFNEVSEVACATFLDIDEKINALTNPPAVRVSASSPEVINYIVQYSSVDIDPSNLAELSIDPGSVGINPEGVWLTGHYIHGSFFGTEGDDTLVESLDTYNYSSTFRNFNTSNNYPLGGSVGVTSGFNEANSSVDRLATRVIFSATPPATDSIHEAKMFAFRISD